jgi:crossover junction endodeoxyribonuclease RuvC
MIILGIDPGLRITGFGAIRAQGPEARVIEAGVIRVTTDKPLGERLNELAAGLAEVIAATKPEAVVIESLYSHYNHPTTAILMGHARGVIILTAAQAGVSVVDYPATRIKKSLTGNGRASKMQMQRTILATLGMAKLPEPADVADALAVALCHANVVRHGDAAGRSR